MPRERLNLDVVAQTSRAQGKLSNLERTLAGLDDAQFGVDADTRDAEQGLAAIKADLTSIESQFRGGVGGRLQVDTTDALVAIDNVGRSLQGSMRASVRLDVSQARTAIERLGQQLDSATRADVRYGAQGVPLGAPGTTGTLADVGGTAGAVRGAVAGGLRGSLGFGLIGAAIGTALGAGLGYVASNINLPTPGAIIDVQSARQEYNALARRLGVGPTTSNRLIQALRSRNTTFSDADLYHIGLLYLAPVAQQERTISEVADAAEAAYLVFPRDTSEALRFITEVQSEFGVYVDLFRQPAFVGGGFTEATRGTEALQARARERFRLGDLAPGEERELFIQREQYQRDVNLIREIGRARLTEADIARQDLVRARERIISGTSEAAFGVLRPEGGEIDEAALSVVDAGRSAELRAVRQAAARQVRFIAPAFPVAPAPADPFTLPLSQQGLLSPEQLRTLPPSLVGQLSPLQQIRRREAILSDLGLQVRGIGLLEGDAQREAIRSTLTTIEGLIPGTGTGTDYNLQLREFRQQLQQLDQTITDRAARVVEMRLRELDREAADQPIESIPAVLARARLATSPLLRRRGPVSEAFFGRGLPLTFFGQNPGITGAGGADLFSDADFTFGAGGQGRFGRGLDALTSDATRLQFASILAGQIASAESVGEGARGVLAQGGGLAAGALVGGAFGPAAGLVAQAATQRLLQGILDNTNFLEGIFGNTNRIAQAEVEFFGGANLRTNRSPFRPPAEPRRSTPEELEEQEARNRIPGASKPTVNVERVEVVVQGNDDPKSMAEQIAYELEQLAYTSRFNIGG